MIKTSYLLCAVPSALALTTLFAGTAFAQSVAPTVSVWEYNEGATIQKIAPTPAQKANLRAAKNMTSMSDIANAMAPFFSKAKIPAVNDGGWLTVDDQSEGGKNYFYRKRNAGISNCSPLTSVNYTYFQTKIDIPEDYDLKKFELSYDNAEMDDGSRITIFNSKTGADGKVIKGSYIPIRKTGTSDLVGDLAKGENRIVVTNIDVCAHITVPKINVELNGQVIAAAPSKPIRPQTAGDVHITSPDGAKFDFQDIGDFILNMSDDNYLMIQVRQDSWAKKKGVSVNTMAAVKLGDDVFLFDTKSDTVLINGQKSSQPLKQSDMPSGFNLSGQGTDYTIMVSGKTGGVRVVMYKDHLDIGVARMTKAKYSGLIGNLNGNFRDDVTTRDGKKKSFPPSAEDLGEWGDSWRVKRGESLFDIPHPTNAEFADGLEAGLQFDKSEKTAASGRCRRAGVSNDTALDNCTYDVAATDDETFIKSALVIQEALVKVPENIVDVKVPETQLPRAKDVQETGGVSLGEFPIRSPKEFDRNFKYYNRANSYYVIFQNDGNFVIYDKNDRFVWGLNLVTKRFGENAVVRFQKDGNLASYTADGGYIWSARQVASPAGSTLDLTSEGALNIVGPDGEVLWSSKG